MFELFTTHWGDKNENRDWNWFLSRITPQMRHALMNEAYRILHNIDDVEDVIQESLIIGCMKCNQLRDETKIFQWMFKIVRREAYNHKSRFSMRKLVNRLIDAFETPPTHPEILLVNDEENSRLYDAVNSLDAITKNIVLLKNTTDMNLKEIAHQLGLNYNTVRSKYQRALEYLRKQLEADSNEEAQK